MTQHTFQQAEIIPQLVKHLTAATASIQLAIGWLDDNGVIGLLQKKAIEGLNIKVILINDEKNKSIATDFQLLAQKGAKIIWLDDAYREKLIDHKFGIIDQAIVLTGNYRWGNNKSGKEETLLLTTAIPTLATGFEKEFEYLSIVNQLSKDEPKPSNPISVLLNKLDVIKALLKIGDTEFIDHRLPELEAFNSDQNISVIYNALQTEAYEEALELLVNFTDYHHRLRDCIEPPIDKLRREIQLLEDEIAAASNEFNETQKTLHRFSKQHSEILGDILQQILFQTKLKAELEAKLDASKQDEYYEAKKDHEDYTKSYKLSKQQKLKSLSPIELKEIKKLYRQNSLKCHPDRVIEEFHDQAEEIFVELNEAYKANDLEKVRDIAEQLKSGMMLSKSEGITELKKLESTVKNLSQKYQTWLDKIEELQTMPAYKTISSIDDWDTYFEDTKEVLTSQLDRLKAFNQEEGAKIGALSVDTESTENDQDALETKT